jgi:hypothetical protein
MHPAVQGQDGLAAAGIDERLTLMRVLNFDIDQIVALIVGLIIHPVTVIIGLSGYDFFSTI